MKQISTTAFQTEWGEIEKKDGVVAGAKRFTFHRCHLASSIIFRNSVVRRRRCSGGSSQARCRLDTRIKSKEEYDRGSTGARDSRTPDFPAEFRCHNKTTVLPAGCTAILSLLFLSSRTTHSLLVRLSPDRLSPVLVGPIFLGAERKNQCDVTCALTPGRPKYRPTFPTWGLLALRG